MINMSSKDTPASPMAVLAMTGTDNIDSQELFQGHQEICIKHAEQVYRLRITRQGKLILTK
jgi:hemin uptake protein HemP